MARLIKILFALLIGLNSFSQTPTAESKLIGPFPAYKGLNNGLRIAFLQILSADAKQTRAGTGFLNKKYPIIIAHHGIGEITSTYPVMASMGTNDLNKLYTTSLPSVLRYTNSSAYNKRYAAVGQTDSTSFCYVFPQVWQGYSTSYASYTYWMIKYIKDSLSDVIDTNRIYLAGLSYGAGNVIVSMQDPDINISIAACMENCGGIETYGTVPVNFKSWAEWGGLTLLAASINDSTAPRNPVTKVGSYYSDRVNDSLLKYKTRIGALVYYRWTTGGHFIWDRPYSPSNATTNYPKTNGQTSNFSTPIQSLFLSWSNKGKRSIP